MGLSAPLPTSRFPGGGPVPSGSAAGPGNASASGAGGGGSGVARASSPGHHLSGSGAANGPGPSGAANSAPVTGAGGLPHPLIAVPSVGPALTFLPSGGSSPTASPSRLSRVAGPSPLAPVAPISPNASQAIAYSASPPSPSGAWPPPNTRLAALHPAPLMVPSGTRSFTQGSPSPALFLDAQPSTSFSGEAVPWRTSIGQGPPSPASPGSPVGSSGPLGARQLPPVGPLPGSSTGPSSGPASAPNSAGGGVVAPRSILKSAHAGSVAGAVERRQSDVAHLQGQGGFTSAAAVVLAATALGGPDGHGPPRRRLSMTGSAAGDGPTPSGGSKSLVMAAAHELSNTLASTHHNATLGGPERGGGLSMSFTAPQAQAQAQAQAQGTGSGQSPAQALSLALPPPSVHFAPLPSSPGSQSASGSSTQVPGPAGSGPGSQPGAAQVPSPVSHASALEGLNASLRRLSMSGAERPPDIATVAGAQRLVMAAAAELMGSLHHHQSAGGGGGGGTQHGASSSPPHSEVHTQHAQHATVAPPQGPSPLPAAVSAAAGLEGLNASLRRLSMSGATMDSAVGSQRLLFAAAAEVSKYQGQGHSGGGGSTHHTAPPSPQPSQMHLNVPGGGSGPASALPMRGGSSALVDLLPPPQLPSSGSSHPPSARAPPPPPLAAASDSSASGPVPAASSPTGRQSLAPLPSAAVASAAAAVAPKPPPPPTAPPAVVPPLPGHLAPHVPSSPPLMQRSPRPDPLLKRPSSNGVPMLQPSPPPLPPTRSGPPAPLSGPVGHLSAAGAVAESLEGGVGGGDVRGFGAFGAAGLREAAAGKAAGLAGTAADGGASAGVSAGAEAGAGGAVGVGVAWPASAELTVRTIALRQQHQQANLARERVAVEHAYDSTAVDPSASKSGSGSGSAPMPSTMPLPCTAESSVRQRLATEPLRFRAPPGLRTSPLGALSESQDDTPKLVGSGSGSGGDRNLLRPSISCNGVSLGAAVAAAAAPHALSPPRRSISGDPAAVGAAASAGANGLAAAAAGPAAGPAADGDGLWAPDRDMRLQIAARASSAGSSTRQPRPPPLHLPPPRVPSTAPGGPGGAAAAGSSRRGRQSDTGAWRPATSGSGSHVTSPRDKSGYLASRAAATAAAAAAAAGSFNSNGHSHSGGGGYLENLAAAAQRHVAACNGSSSSGASSAAAAAASRQRPRAISDSGYGVGGLAARATDLGVPLEGLAVVGSMWARVRGPEAHHNTRYSGGGADGGGGVGASLDEDSLPNPFSASYGPDGAAPAPAAAPGHVSTPAGPAASGPVRTSCSPPSLGAERPSLTLPAINPRHSASGRLSTSGSGLFTWGAGTGGVGGGGPTPTAAGPAVLSIPPLDTSVGSLPLKALAAGAGGGRAG
ncbi:hypothetical protein HYH03_016249 [Edaphochlamys debaryana]|uniref:Uncharacterized protein n=1 Tax=Edaphochlamys debaryana TaxID=47281 RepID=A0A835XKA0_9CHLO|nr:hypothetical protein HYH03_016249 [Edaphochlamys debaryana]|eukprot:KAG2484950.1 hypothetical protein HYH03_016249 [Edaphochlamys debaryana]